MESTATAVDLDLVELLGNRAWQMHRKPFPHVTAHDVFVRSFYLELVVAFETALRAGSFRRDMPGYDATGLTFGPDLDGPLRVFMSRPWHDLMCRFFDVEGTGQMSGGLHSHEPGSRPGGVHNDLNPGHFPAVATDGEIVIADRARCEYGSGRATAPDVHISKAMRAVAMIYYLGNPTWEPGDGGETGLYRAATANVTEPDVAIPPISNSIVVFECTPFSFHGFARTCRHVRNAVVAWTHRSPADVAARWSDYGVVAWT